MKKLLFVFLMFASSAYCQYWETDVDGLSIVNNNKDAGVHVLNGFKSSGSILGEGNFDLQGVSHFYNNVYVSGNIYHSGSFYLNSNLLVSSQWQSNSNCLFYSDKIGIGTTNPGTFKLAVEGNIGARGLKITLQNPWPDFVFSEKYDLMKLPELKKYIEENNKLPNVPSEQEVKDNGMDVEEMTAKLLQKVEELTLHVIRLDEQNKELQSEIEILNNKK